MTVAVKTAGLAAIYIGNKGDSFGSMSLLGYTRNGADTSTEAFYEDVHGDANGGDSGPPIEVQFLGEIARVRLELTKWDSTVADNVASRSSAVAAGGGTVDPGTLLFANGSLTMYRVLVWAPNMPINYPCCMVRAPIEVNRGTKFSTLVLEFEAHKDNVSGSSTENTLYNQNTA